VSAIRWIAAIAGAVIVALAAAMLVARWGDAKAGTSGLAEPRPSTDLIARGAYLASMGDCAACHSIPGKPAMSGGLRMSIPIGAIYTTNITPDPTYGIGKYTLDDFDRALRFGVAEGHSLYPAMPYTSYASTRPEDVEALYAYFKFGVSPAEVPNKTNDIAFPLSMRWPLTYWRWMFAPTAKPYRRSPPGDSTVAQGGYFVDGLGHCGECHTPRAIALQLKATNVADGLDYLSGALIEGYFAPSLRSAGQGTLSEWSVDELAEFLSTGTNAKGTAFASMSDVITHSSQRLTQQDAVATARYLKTVTDAGAVEFRFSYDEKTHAELKRGADAARGARIYLDNCASCHRPDGRGYDRVFPPLAGNAIVLAPNPASLVSVVLQGAMTPRTASTPAQFAMPSFAWRLSDPDVADVVTFIRASWGNDAAAVDAAAVQSLRPPAPTEMSR
jgi:alcohol dehydrogenase (quinone), cytochrome c subunit